MRVLLLSEQEIEKLITIPKVIEAVETAFKEKALGYSQMPSKVYLDFKKHHGDLRVMPAYLQRLDLASVKIVNSHPENPKKYGLTTVSGTLLLIDPKNGALLSIMGATHLTSLRTAAAGAIAAKYLANKNSKTVAFIGAGVQAKSQLQALIEVFPKLEEIRISDISQKTAKVLATDAKKQVPDAKIMIKEDKKAVSGADIVITTTPSKKPIVLDSWISDGVHLNCIGADAPEKQEIDPKILLRAKIVVDDREQAAHSGEINVPITKGILTTQNIWAEIGEIINGTTKGRTSAEEITVFDSTGLAIQDATTADLIYKKAITTNKGQIINI